MTGTARQEAERLVAALLARASQSDAAGLGDLLRSFTGTGSQQHNRSTGWATGTAECCVCPVCRAIAAVRDPDPHTAERLATGAGDLATGVSSILRAFSTLAGATSAKPRPRPAARPQPTPDQAWSAATDHTPGPASPPDETTDPWGAATRSPAPEPEPPADEAADLWSAATRSPESEPPATTREPAPEPPAATRGPAPEAEPPAATRGPAPEVEPPVDRTGDPWGAATRHEAAARPAGPVRRPAASTMSKDADPAVVEPRPRTEESDVVKPTRGRKTDIGAATTGNRPVDPWAAAVANDANRVSRPKTGVAGTGSVDHDVAAQETPAPAEDRGTRAGDDAPGDAV